MAIARFRLLLVAMRACGITRLVDAPAFHINVACGDSLLHGSRQQMVLGDWTPLAHYFRSEDSGELERLLVRGRYHSVVANPPYITPKDRALNQAYRDRYSVPHEVLAGGSIHGTHLSARDGWWLYGPDHRQ